MITPPYAFGRYGSDVNTARILEQRRQLDDLSRQLSTDRVSETYSGLGSGAGKSLDLHARLSAIDSYQSTIADMKLRVTLMDKSLGQISEAARKQSSELLGGFEPLTNGQTIAQATATTRLSEALDMLNQSVGGRYLFAGRATDAPPVASASEVMEGSAGRAGLKTLIAERVAADQGSPVTGRITLPALASGATTVALSEEAGSGPFGLKFASVTGNLGGATIQRPPATPGALSVDFSGGALPADGETLSIRFTLPDGTTTDIALTARTALNAASGETAFQIGTTAAETATNFFNVLQGSVAKEAGTSLPAASSIAAAQNFFSASPSNPPLRVSGSPASALVAGTAANTVIWYSGDNHPDPRGTALARIDESSLVKVGAQANESAISKVLANFGALAGQTLSATDPLTKERYAQLSNRVKSSLAGSGSSMQSIDSIRTELGMSVSQASRADERHKATKGTFQLSLAGIETISKEEVVAQLLSVQNALQASYQITATMAKLKLSDYI
jgi:flagellar hook-associated protein 3 FlgL